jgi:hypothetical protein
VSELINWLPWLLVLAIPGVINIAVAFKQLADDCKFLPFFEPFKTGGVWVWAAAQFLFPCFLFWMTTSMTTRPTIDWALVSQALGFGVGFVTLMNARTDTGFFTLDIKIIYARLIRVAYALIASKETGRTAAFWTDVERILNLCPDLTDGVDFLENYFRNDVSLTAEQKANRQEKLDAVLKKNSRAAQAEAILSLMDVRRADLPNMLMRFGCSPNFLKQYFPKARIYGGN